jgi:hypothetical protein
VTSKCCLAALLCAYRTLEEKNSSSSLKVLGDLKDALAWSLNAKVRSQQHHVLTEAANSLIPFKVSDDFGVILGLCSAHDSKCYLIFSDYSLIDLGYLRTGNQIFEYTSRISDKKKGDGKLPYFTQRNFYDYYLPTASELSAPPPSMQWDTEHGSELIVDFAGALEKGGRCYIQVTCESNKSTRNFNEVKARKDKNGFLRIGFSPEQLIEIHTLSIVGGKLIGQILGLSIKGPLPEVGSDQVAKVQIGFAPDAVKNHPLSRKLIRVSEQLVEDLKSELWWFDTRNQGDK